MWSTKQINEFQVNDILNVSDLAAQTLAQGDAATNAGLATTQAAHNAHVLSTVPSPRTEFPQIAAFVPTMVPVMYIHSDIHWLYTKARERLSQKGQQITRILLLFLGLFWSRELLELLLDHNFLKQETAT